MYEYIGLNCLYFSLSLSPPPPTLALSSNTHRIDLLSTVLQCASAYFCPPSAPLLVQLTQPPQVLQ